MTKTYTEQVQENARNHKFLTGDIYRSINGFHTKRIYNADKPIMDFSQALTLLKDDVELTRLAWIKENVRADEFVPMLSKHQRPYTINKPGALRTSALFLHRQNEQGHYSPWIPNHEDLFAEDWVAISRIPNEGTGVSAYEGEDPANDQHVTGEGGEQS